jgi:tRNA(Ile)-lysidine synthase
MLIRPRLTPEMADARRCLRDAMQIAGLAAGDRVILGVSGGSDSLALAAAFAFEGSKLGLIGQVIIVDHNLQIGSELIAQEAAERTTSLGLESKVVAVEVRIKKEGLEAAAREARYQALEKARGDFGAQLVLLGHTLDDQAETVLLGLVRGSGLKSLSGMPVLDSERKLLRPFLGLSKATLRKSLEDQEISWWEDPHNGDPKFTRVRTRQILANLDSELGPGLPSALARTAEIAAEAEEYLVQSAMVLIDLAKSSDSKFRAQAFADSHKALSHKAIQLICNSFGARNLSRAQVLEVMSLVTNFHGQKKLTFSGITVERVKDLLVFRTI